MKTRNMRGFTLTELLVAVAVGSIIMMGIYSVFMNSLNIFQGQQDVGQIQFNAKAVTSFMREKIANTGSGIQSDIPLPALVFQNNAANLSSHYQVGSDALQVRTFGNAGDIMTIDKYMGSAATADAVLLPFMTTQMAVYVFVHTTHPGIGGTLLMGMAMGGALLAKGPVGLLPMLSILIMIWLDRAQGRALRQLVGLSLALVLGSIIFLAWGIPAI